MSIEIWKPIKDFDGYFISNFGRVKNSKGKILKYYVQNSGYQVIKLHKNKKGHHKLIHRLVAETFIDNPNNKPEVNHKDGNKQNNKVENLEWVTPSENRKHAIELGLYDKIFTIKSSLGMKIGKTSKYRYVTYDKSRQKYAGTIRRNGINYKQKRFNTEEEAAMWANFLIYYFNIEDAIFNKVAPQKLKGTIFDINIYK